MPTPGVTNLLVGFAKALRKTGSLGLLIAVVITTTGATGPSTHRADHRAPVGSAVSPSNPSPTYAWHTFYGPIGPGKDIAIGPDGSIYIAGFSDAGWLGDNDSPGRHPYTGGDDLLVMKLSANGVYEWHTFYGSSSLDRSAGIAVDGEGNVYVTGRSESSWLGDNGAAPLHSFGGPAGTASDIFVMKLDASGAYQWHTFYGESEFGEDLVLDQDANIYVLASSAAGWTGDGGAVALHPHSGMWDWAVLKLTGQGTYLWHAFYGGSDSFDWGESIALGTDGSIHVLGSSSATWQAGQAPPLHPHSGGAEFCVTKLDGTGAYQWHTFYGSDGVDTAEGMALDPAGNILVLGHSFLPWLGDQGAGPLHLHDGYWNFAVMKLGPDGAYQWHTFYGYNEGSDGDITTDRLGNVYFTSLSETPWQGDQGAPAAHPFAGGRDIVIAKLSSEGSYRWHSFYGGTAHDYGEAIANDGNGDLYVAGGSQGTWQGDGNAAPLHPYSGLYALALLKFDRSVATRYLPLITR